MKIHLLLMALFTCLCVKAQSLTPQVNENVELMAILSRVAGFPEYHMDTAGSYTSDIDRHFKDVADHPAAVYLRELRQKHGIAYDAVMSMAIHLRRENDAFSLVKEEVNSLEKRWAEVDKARFLSLLADFYRDSHFHDFFQAHQEVYAKGLQAYEEHVSRHVDTRWYESFYGKKADEDYVVIIGFCNGEGNYGVHRHVAGKRKEVFAIVGYSVNQSDEPLYGKGHLATLIHEFNHSFVNPLLDAGRYPHHVAALEKAGNDLYQSSRRTMLLQAYGNWQTMINESVVRAAVICYMLDKDYAPEEVSAELSEQMQRNFRWMPELVCLLRKYEKKRNRYGSLENFYPRVIRFFTDYAEGENKRFHKIFER